MTDFLPVPIWLLLSWLIRQVEGGIVDNEPGAQVGNETGSKGVGDESGIQAIEGEPYEPVEQAIKIAIAAFSLLLLGLSLSAYKKTALKRILYASVAFGLFAVQMFFEYLGDTVPAFAAPFNDAIFAGITLAILALFFMAIVRKK